jgi:hypothetical protein
VIRGGVGQLVPGEADAVLLGIEGILEPDPGEGPGPARGADEKKAEGEKEDKVKISSVERHNPKE